MLERDVGKHQGLSSQWQDRYNSAQEALTKSQEALKQNQNELNETRDEVRQLRDEIRRLKAEQEAKDADASKDPMALLKRSTAGLKAFLEQDSQIQVDVRGILQEMRTILETLTDGRGELEKLAIIQPLIGGGITPRKVLYLHLLEIFFRPPDDKYIRSKVFENTPGLMGMSVVDYDIPLDHSAVHKFVQNFDQLTCNTSLKLTYCTKICGICYNPRFLFQDDKLKKLNEFLGSFQVTECCSRAICLMCLKTAIKTSVKKDWWHNLNNSAWIKCPREDCGKPIGIRRPDEIITILTKCCHITDIGCEQRCIYI